MATIWSAMRFFAVYNISQRFPVYQAPLINISGRWSVHFKGTNDSTESVGEFTQRGSHVTGTFLTITGDYRFWKEWSAVIHLKLSTFDGGHAYYFTSKILDSNRMTEGFYYAGAHIDRNLDSRKKPAGKTSG